jgi:hypothetical protein
LITILKVFPHISWRFCLLQMYWEQYTRSSSIKFNISDSQWTARPHTINFFSKTITHLGNLATCLPWSVCSSIVCTPDNFFN